MKLFTNIRFYILFSSIVLSYGIYFYTVQIIPTERLQTIRLTQWYALLSLGYLYVAMLAGPLCYTFFTIPFREYFLKARRALGVSAFYFGLLHACIAFFSQLGGFEGLGFLSNKYLLAIGLSFTALLILFFMAATSFDSIIRIMHFKRWKILHRLVYIASILILIHALMLGTQFSDLSQFIPQLFFGLFAFLIVLEAIRFDAFLQEKLKILPRLGITASLVIGFISFSYIYSLLPTDTTLPLAIHSQRTQLAQETQKSFQKDTAATVQFPGSKGDRTKRFTVDFLLPETVQPNRNMLLRFKVFDASNGNEVIYFNKVNGKLVHMIIVDSSLAYFDHIHPTLENSTFTVTTQFPRDGNYRIYLDFQPFGAIEQQIATTIKVGKNSKIISSPPPNLERTKVVGQYEITLQKPDTLKSEKISIGQQILSFTIKDAQSKQPVTTLKPYLEAFGHLVMINQETFEYVHVHPNDLSVPEPNENGGPTVEFIPLGLYTPIKPGIYRIFAQFNPNDTLITTDFTIEVK